MLLQALDGAKHAEINVSYVDVTLVFWHFQITAPCFMRGRG